MENRFFVLEKEWQEMITRYALVKGERNPTLSEALSHAYHVSSYQHADIEFEPGVEMSFVFTPWR